MKENTLRQSGLSLFLGAGASMDMGFPSGARLKDRITKDLLCRESTELGRIAACAFPEIGNEFAHALESTTATSIDEFLDEHRQFLEIGRFVVWYVILEHERKARTCPLEQFWLHQLLARLFGDVHSIQDLDRLRPNGAVSVFHDLAINTLNYDRLAEYGIQAWLSARFPRADLGRFDDMLNPGVLVRHSHGSLGPLTGDGALGFGAECPTSLEKALAQSARLRFWFEPDNSANAFARTNRIIELRGTLVVMGFGHHPAICRRFSPFNGPNVKLQRILATRRGQPDGNAAQWLRATYGFRDIELQLMGPEAGCRETVERLFVAN